MWAMLIHLSGAVGTFLAMWGLPGNLLIPLIAWLIKREDSPFIDDQGKEAVNFQITMTIAGFVCWLLIFTFVFACIGFPLLIALGIYEMVVAIIAGVKANEGVPFRYPLTIRLIK